MNRMGALVCRLLLPLAAALALLLAGGSAAAAPTQAEQPAGSTNVSDMTMKEQLGQLPVDPVERYWNDLMRQYGGYFPGTSPPGFMDMLLPGGEGWSLSAFLKGLLRYLFHELLVNGKLLTSIVVLTVFGMMLETMQSAFEKKAVAKIAHTISLMVIIVIAINSFHVAIDYAKSAIESMIHFMVAVVPLMLTMLASTGNVTSAAVLHPLIVFMIHAVGTAVYTIVFPLFFFSAVLHIVSALSERYKVTQLASLLRSVGALLLGVLVTLFLGVITVRGATGAVTDGVAIRTAKYIAGNFVPVVGTMFADATDTVISASLLVKNAIGLTGVIILILLCAFPAIKILTLALIYNFAAAVMQPLGDSPIVGCLQTVGKSMLYVFAALAAVALMFFLAISIVIAAGNVSVMMR
ncbi:stage III sporulation protein AE [Paenibacillus cymbidii]|uniref:stage III sporulation protein AE n=1 Tax=Paenibacillus cymbidii TaxID=1639034 RepID=UPI001082030E|nr:stage III sporulation protein AE [Paenibacillus cymbidii]